MRNSAPDMSYSWLGTDSQALGIMWVMWYFEWKRNKLPQYIVVSTNSFSTCSKMQSRDASHCTFCPRKDFFLLYMKTKMKIHLAFSCMKIKLKSHLVFFFHHDFFGNVCDTIMIYYSKRLLSCNVLLQDIALCMICDKKLLIMCW